MAVQIGKLPGGMAEEAAFDALSLPRHVQIVLSGLATMLHIDEGNWTLEIVFQQGEPHRVWRRHGPVGLDELEQLSSR